MTPCPIHHKPPILVYPCCVGAQGGRATTPAKRASSARNAQKARQATQARRPLSGDTSAPESPALGPATASRRPYAGGPGARTRARAS